MRIDTRVVSLNRTIPSHSHNSRFSVELGQHWPAGERFRILPKRDQRFFGKMAVEQIEGEQVILIVSCDEFESLFC